MAVQSVVGEGAAVSPASGTGKRYKLRFRSTVALEAALAMESPEAAPVVVNEKRRYVSYAPGHSPFGIDAGFNAAIAAENRLNAMAAIFDAEVVEDYQYQIDDDGPDVLIDAAETADEGSLGDVTALIRAAEAWDSAQGSGVVIAIVDTGIDGSHAEFAPARRFGQWAAPGDDAWTDWEGHGTMCACIATADSTRYRGVAPEAGLMACKTRFYDSELGLIYDTLTARAQEGTRIVASNSFGRQTGSPPPLPTDSDFLPALDDAVAAGVIVVFSAGNNHALAGGAASACTPNSVWLHKSRADLMAVATCDLDKAMWYYSSRGPGQFYGSANTSRKPDVTAPTPANGRILYGPGERVLANGWGTSGACPQVAGLAALLLSADASLDAQRIFDLIRANATGLGHGVHCEGAGMIDCAATLAAQATV